MTMSATPRAASALSAFSYLVCADQLPSEQQQQRSHEGQRYKLYVQAHVDTIKECIFLCGNWKSWAETQAFGCLRTSTHMNRIMLDIRLRIRNDSWPASDAEHMYALQSSLTIFCVYLPITFRPIIYTKGDGTRVRSENRDNANSLCPQTVQEQKSL